MSSASHPDFILSDIHLADGLPFQIRKNSTCKCPIIFTTAYDQYSIQAFKVNSIDYLLKPIEATDLERSLTKLEQLSHVNSPQPDWQKTTRLIERKEPSYRERFLAQHRQEWLPLQTSNLRQVYSENGLTFALGTNNQRYLLDESLDRIGFASTGRKEVKLLVASMKFKSCSLIARLGSEFSYEV